MNLRFGLVGFGAWGRVHADAIARSAVADLTAVATPDATERAAVRAAYPGVQVSASHLDLLRHEAVDVVCVVTPNASHETIAVAALEAGKHVLVEKPMAVDAIGCTRMMAAADRNSRILNVAHQLRVSRQWRDLKERIDAGRIGAPRCMHVNLWRRPFRSGACGWRYDPDQVGSWLLEELVHYADLAAWYFESLGDPLSVMAVANSRRPTTDLYDNTSLTLRWQDGSFAVLTQTLAGFEHHKVVEVVGANGAVRAGWSGRMDRTDSAAATLRVLEGLAGDERFDNGEPTEVELAAGQGEVTDLKALIAAVVDGIAHGRACISGAAGRRAVLLCEAAEESIRTGAPVTVSP